MTVDPHTDRLLASALARVQHDQRLPSVAAGIVRDGELAWSGAVGTVDGRSDGVAATADTQYRIGSITKTFIAVCVLRLRDAGRLDLEDRYDQHVPGTAFGRATIAQLLTHTSGLQSETDGPWWERTPGGDWDALASPSPVQRLAAGSRFHYSNVGFAALGELVARAHGRPWADVVSDDLLEPLGMRRTSLRPDGPAAVGLAVHPFADLVLEEPEHDAGAMAPAGQLWSTVQDLARWAAFMGGRTEGLLADSTLAEMRSVRAVNDLPGKPWTAGMGLGWQLWNEGGRRYVGHGGSMPGFQAQLLVDIESGDGVVFFTNSTALAVGPGKDLLTTFREREPRDPEPWHAAETDAALLELVGLWHWGPAVTMVRATADGGLELGTPGEGRGARFRREGDHWVGLENYYAGEPLRVVRDGTGAVSHLDLASFRFTRLPYDPERDIPGGVAESGWH